MSTHPGSPVHVRSVADGEWDAWNLVDAHAFGMEESPEHAEFWNRVREPERCIGAYDGDQPVGAAAAFTFSMTVPGGSAVPVAGVSAVGVLPTHRRRGVLTAMMRHQLDGLYESGEPVAALTASEPAIYGRYGYGLATWGLELRTRAVGAAAGLPEGPGAEVRMRLADPTQSLPACLKVYNELLPSRPGLIARTNGWEHCKLVDPAGDRAGATPLRCVLAEVDGEVRGYAYYATIGDWTETGPNGTTVVRECLAVDWTTRLALWRYLFGLDLMKTVRVSRLPLDDPLLHQLADPRAAQPSFRDGMFVRLVDVGRALSARTYAAPVDVVLDVRDEFCPWNTRRWRLSGDAHGARCEATSDPADIALGVRELGALYLGGVTARPLAAAGRVEERTAGSLARLSAACASDPLPWLSFGF